MAKGLTVRKPKGNIVKEIDAAIALLVRARALAASDGASPKVAKKATTKTLTKRVVSAEAREAIATAQRKRWAKIKRLKKKAARAA
jgi:hypothetical protein